MIKWLTFGAAALLVWSGEASAQVKGQEAARFEGVTRPRSPELHAVHNLRIPQTGSVTSPHIDVGMLVSEDVAPNAVVGLGLMNMAGRKKSSATVGMNSGSRRKPAVTFVLHF